MGFRFASVVVLVCSAFAIAAAQDEALATNDRQVLEKYGRFLGPIGDGVARRDLAAGPRGARRPPAGRFVHPGSGVAVSLRGRE